MDHPIAFPEDDFFGAANSQKLARFVLLRAQMRSSLAAIPPDRRFLFRNEVEEFMFYLVGFGRRFVKQRRAKAGLLLECNSALSKPGEQELTRSILEDELAGLRCCQEQLVAAGQTAMNFYFEARDRRDVRPSEQLTLKLMELLYFECNDMR